MRIRILKVKTGKFENATIERSSRRALPSLHDEEWRFNFATLSKRLPNSSTYVLVTEESPEKIEGCLIFQMVDDEVPYGAFIEVAPHNRGNEKEYEHIAGCLLAFACGLSFQHGKGIYKGQLFFDVLEENEKDELKLRNNYISRYGAEAVDGTTLKIADNNGQALIKKYLGSEQDSGKT